MPTNEGPTTEVIKTCDKCKFIGMNYRCYHADAPADDVLEYDYEKVYTPDWCPVDKNEMVAVRKDDLLEDSEMKEVLELLFQWDSEHGRGPLNPVIRKLEEIVKRKEEQ